MISPHVTRIASVMIACAAAVVCTGCGGGASEEPTVTLKPSTPAGSGEPSGGAAQAGGGTTTAATGQPGNLSGVVMYEGTHPQLEPVVVVNDPKVDPKDRAVCAAKPIPDQSLIVGPSGGVKNVFIYLDKTPSGASVKPASEDPLIFDQKDCTFFPHTLLVRTDRTIKVLNSDGVAHNTHTLPQRNNQFNNLIQAHNSVGLPLIYTKRESFPVQVKCDIHGWMKAYQLPLEHDFAAITDEEGKFEIRDLPAGTHKFTIWQEKAGYLERNHSVMIKPGETTEIKLSYDSQKFASFNGPRPKVVYVASQP